MTYPPKRLAFAGTPDFAACCLQSLIANDHAPALVFTQPDRPAGRGRRLLASPVKQLAELSAIPVMQPARMDAATATVLEQHEIDLMIVVAYGQLVPAEVLDAPALGCWNIHASLLPRWRGAAPIQRAIAAGDDQTGVCLMQMDRGLDTGAVLARRVLSIGPEETAGQLHDRLARAGADLLVQVLAQPEPPEAIAQDEHGVSYAHKLSKQEAALDFSVPAFELARRVRAFNPFPVATLGFAGQRLRVFSAMALPDASSEQLPGTVLRMSPEGIDVACGEGVLRLLELQRPGGKPLPVQEFLGGAAKLGLSKGERFD